MDSSILYLHGFCSSPQSWKARVLEAYLHQWKKTVQFHCPFLSHVPKEAVRQAENILAELDGNVVLIGSSLGGFYATWLAETYGLKTVLINPAVLANMPLSLFLGEQTNLYTLEKFEMTAEHVGQLQSMQRQTITPAHYLLMVETGDTLLDYRQAVAYYAGCRQTIIEGGDHSFTHFNDLIPQMLEFAGL